METMRLIKIFFIFFKSHVKPPPLHSRKTLVNWLHLCQHFASAAWPIIYLTHVSNFIINYIIPFCHWSIGVVPATNFVKGSGLAMSKRGFVTVDKVDTATFPCFIVNFKIPRLSYTLMLVISNKSIYLV